MNSFQKISILLITGTVGVGKTSVADEVYETLKTQKVLVALINIDELGYAVPRPVDDPFNTRLQIKNLSVIWPNYSELGVKSLIIPCVVENEDDVESFRKAIPNAVIFVARLDASLATIEDRIKGRLMGGSLEWHLQRAKELKELFAENRLEDVVISTDKKTTEQVSKELVALWPR
jgi:adenylylsulfate kinase